MNDLAFITWLPCLVQEVFPLSRWVKTALARSTEQRKKNKDPRYRRWTEVLPNIVSTFNNRRARGTKFKRKDIDEGNYQGFLNELFQTDDVTLQWNTPTINASHFGSNKWLRRLFSYNIGEKVIVRKVAEYSAGRKSSFAKPSVTGRFGSKVRVVKARLLKRTLDSSLMVPGEF